MGRGKRGSHLVPWWLLKQTTSVLTTEMASQSQGIQQLLQAEKRAAEKVADATKRKAQHLKQAKEQAQMEVDQYRREREQEFQSKQQAVSRGGVEMGPPVCMLGGISGGMCPG